MDYVLSTLQMQEADKYTISKGIPSIDLMEKAGKAIFDTIINNIDNIYNKSILIVVGKGGNGGDGYVVARYLFEANIDVKVLDINESLREETKINRDRFKGEIFNSIKKTYKFLNNNKKFDILIDAILGIGTKREVQSPFSELINFINDQKSFVVSIDINSGINSENGRVMGCAVKSNLTIAIQEYKYGHFFNEGIDFYKTLLKVDIGIISEKYGGFAGILNHKAYKTLFKKRLKNTNKGSFGRCLLIGGSKTMMGSVLLSLSSLCPLLLGSGYSTIGIPESLHPLYALKNLETMYLLFKDQNGELIYDEETLKKTLTYDSIGIGMGLNISEEIYKTLCFLIQNYKENLLIDADGLNSLSKFGIDILKEKRCKNIILSPHLKEFSRLSGFSMEEIKNNPIEVAKEFASKYKITLVLKSNVTIITDGIETFINASGSPALAKGGSGDVLSGLIVGMSLKSENSLLTSACASYILGRTSELAVQEYNENSLLGSNLQKYISKVIDEIQNC